ncbi:MAG: hypothetical protein MRQ07_03225 [Candidatus Midichloria sp.]|nr:hypothetical protein [Candidatus Midichloria sp.]
MSLSKSMKSTPNQVAELGRRQSILNVKLPQVEDTAVQSELNSEAAVVQAFSPVHNLPCSNKNLSRKAASFKEVEEAFT